MAEMALADGIDRLESRAKILQALLLIGLLLVVAVLAGEIGEYRGAVDLDASDPTSFGNLYMLALLATVAVAILTVVLFGMWIYRAAANIVAAGVDGFDYTPGWAVGWYFVPIANLFKPFAAMRQIWNASHGAGREALDHGNVMLTIWWASWLVSNIANNVSTHLALRAETPAEYQTSLIFGMVGSLVSLILYPAALRLVAAITKAQRERLAAAHIFA